MSVVGDALFPDAADATNNQTSAPRNAVTINSYYLDFSRGGRGNGTKIFFVCAIPPINKPWIFIDEIYYIVSLPGFSIF